VAHIIQKGSLEFPQKYGKPITYGVQEFMRKYGNENLEKIPLTDRIIKNGEIAAIRIQNRLSFDVEFYARKLIEMAEKEVGHLYPADEKGNKPIAYYWARVGTCSNPTCQAEVPLLKGFYLVNKPGKKVYLKPGIKGKEIEFEIKEGSYDGEGWNYRGNLKCPICGNTTDVKTIKEQSKSGEIKERLLAVIQEGKSGKDYRSPSIQEFQALKAIPEDIEVPSEKMQRNSAGGDTFGWGVTKWGQLFSPRQLHTLHTLVAQLKNLQAELQPETEEYGKAVVTYLGIVISKYSDYNNSFAVWTPGAENFPIHFQNKHCQWSLTILNQIHSSTSTGSAAIPIRLAHQIY
jgi:putative DNA methylase